MTFDPQEFHQETENFEKKLQKKIHSYFYITEEQFDLCAFKIFKKEFFDYADLFLSEDQKLTQICLMKRENHIFVRGINLLDPQQNKDIVTNSESDDISSSKDDLLLHKKHLDYIDHPIKLWNDLDVKIKNYFVERYIGIIFFKILLIL